MMSVARSPTRTSLVPEKLQPNFAGNCQNMLFVSSSLSSAVARGRTSARAGSTPLSGSTMILRIASAPSSASIRPVSFSAASACEWLSVVRPRNCRLPRLVRSISPEPNSAATFAIVNKSARRSVPTRGLTRNISPSPDCIGRNAPGHQPLRNDDRDVILRPPARKDYARRYRCGADARGRARWRPRSGGASRRSPRGSRAR